MDRESIAMGWSEYNEGRTEDIVTKISNCCHEIAKWRKTIHHMGRKKLMIFKNNRSKEEILEVSRKLQDAYKDEEDY